MAHNLRWQLKEELQKALSFGESKKACRENHGNTEAKIYSYSTRNNMYDLVDNLTTYIKQNHPDVKKISDLNQTIMQDFLDSKKTTCSTKTLELYKANIKKLDAICKVNHPSVSFYDKSLKTDSVKDKRQTEKVRSISMPDNDYHKMMACLKDSDSKMGIKVAHAFGLRASEITSLRYSDIHKNGIYIYNSKGGRDRFISARNAEQKEMINELKQHCYTNHIGGNSKVLDVNTKTIQKTFVRGCERAGLTQYKEHKTNIHALRKEWARKYYSELGGSLEEGKFSMKIWNVVDKELGHGDNRVDLAKAYLCM